MDNKNQNNPAPQNAEHPVGVGLGAAATGAVAGALGGAVAGPVGAVAGAAVGAVVGGLAGKSAAEMVNPTIESKYWLDQHPSRPYATSAFSYDEFAPAYKYGWESYHTHGGKGKTFQSEEGALSKGWDTAKGSSRLAWDQAKDASRDAWNRVESAAHGFAHPKA